MISVFINSLTSGGAEKVVLTLLDRFKTSEKSLELILIEKKRFYELPQGIPSKYLTSYESMESGILKMPYLFVCAWRLKKSIINPRQIVQSHLLRASFINVIAKMFGSKHHAQIVVHSRINFNHQPFYYRFIAKWIYTQIFKRADSIVSICQVMKNDLDDYLQLKSHPQHRAIYNPHDLKDIQEKAKRPTPSFQFSKNKQYLISVGRLVNGKRINDLINALSKIETQHPNLEVIIIGGGDLRKELEKQALDLHLNHRVHFLGYQQNPYAFIAQADLLVLSSEWEGLPNVLIESMACGTPVVSADCISGPREIINPGSDLSSILKDKLEYGKYGVLYPVGSVDLLADAIHKLLSDKILYENYIQEGLKRAEDFDQVKIAKEYLSTFTASLD